VCHEEKSSDRTVRIPVHVRLGFTTWGISAGRRPWLPLPDRSAGSRFRARTIPGFMGCPTEPRQVRRSHWLIRWRSDGHGYPSHAHEPLPPPVDRLQLTSMQETPRSL